MKSARLRVGLLVTWIAFAVGSCGAGDLTQFVGSPTGPHAVIASATLTSEEAEGESKLFDAIGQGELTTGVVLGALALAFGLGALHSLSPGHGKTLVAAYLVGSRGTVTHAIALGGIVTFTHVFSVLILGLIALLAANYLLPEQLTPVLGAMSGLLIVGVGLFMFRRAFRSVDGRVLDEADHVHTHSPATERVTMGSLVALGVSGGMVPCPSALVVLLTAVALRRIVLGLALVVSFSLGLALVLIVIGILLVTAKGFMERFGGQAVATRAARVLPFVSATVITTVGVIICWHSLLDAGEVFL
jgi:ABC-type nickel/cobalt efflux system permease component RcnA